LNGANEFSCGFVGASRRGERPLWTRAASPSGAKRHLPREIAAAKSGAVGARANRTDAARPPSPRSGARGFFQGLTTRFSAASPPMKVGSPRGASIPNEVGDIQALVRYTPEA